MLVEGSLKATRLSMLGPRSPAPPPPSTPPPLLETPSELGSQAFMVQAVRFVLAGASVRKFTMSGKGRPHPVFLRVIPCSAPGPLAVYWVDGAPPSFTRRARGKLGELRQVDDELCREGERIDEFKGDHYFDRELQDEELFLTMTLQTRSLFLLASTLAEKSMWIIGINALKSGRAFQLAEVQLAVEAAEHAPTWMRKVFDSLYPGMMVRIKNVFELVA